MSDTSYPNCCDFHRETNDMFILMKCTNRTDGENEAARLREQLDAAVELLHNSVHGKTWDWPEKVNSFLSKIEEK